MATWYEVCEAFWATWWFLRGESHDANDNGPLEMAGALRAAAIMADILG